jgi:hypothetical protein
MFSSARRRELGVAAGSARKASPWRVLLAAQVAEAEVGGVRRPLASHNHLFQLPAMRLSIKLNPRDRYSGSLPATSFDVVRSARQVIGHA